MKKFIIVLFVLVAALFGFLVYSGLFETVEIKETEMGPFRLAYREHTGDYAKAGEILEEVYTILLKDLKVTTGRGIGIYYDDPKKVPENKLRSEIGCIIEERDAPRIADIAKKLKVKEIPRQKVMSAEFPHRNTVSLFIGIFKVYPAIEDYISRKGYGHDYSIELYDMPRARTFFIVPVREKAQ